MNYSRQRELVRKTVEEHPGHITAGEVYAIVRKMMPNISLGTVYRNLNTLCEHDMLSMLYYAGKEHFEAYKEKHSHVACAGCGKIFDVDLPLFGWLDDMVRQQTGIEVAQRELMAYGLCAQCQSSE